MNYPYRTYASYLRETYQQPTKKISLHAGFSCPNRDGTLSLDGCIYCEPSSFSPHAQSSALPLMQQLHQGVTAGHHRGIHCFVAYFQSYTNTYAPVSKLHDTYDTIRAFPEIKGLTIGTRPDCLDYEKAALINSYTNEYEVWLELGLQSSHNQTLRLINRGHEYEAFEQAVSLLRDFPKIKRCAHVILGLPGETQEMETQTAKRLADYHIDGVKIHPLYVVKGTALAEAYGHGKITLLTQDEYVMRAINFLGYLPKDTVIQRLTADCPDDDLIAPDWIKHKQQLLNQLVTSMKEQKIQQGSYSSSS